MSAKNCHSPPWIVEESKNYDFLVDERPDRDRDSDVGPPVQTSYAVKIFVQLFVRSDRSDVAYGDLSGPAAAASKAA